MENARLQIWINFGQFLLGTFALGAVTLMVNSKIQEREVEIREQQQITTVLDSAMKEKVGDRLLLARFFSTVTRSDTIRARWKVYRDEVEQENRDFTALVVQQNAQVEKATSSNASPQVIDELKAARDNTVLQITPSSGAATLPSRVYFHISSEGLRQKAATLSRLMAVPNERVIPGIELKENSPNDNELRYFHRSEKLEADSMAQTLRGLGVDISSKYVAGYEDSNKIRPRHFELWLSHLESFNY